MRVGVESALTRIPFPAGPGRRSRVRAGQVQRGLASLATISGANFQPGASVSFTDPAFSVTGVTVNGCHQLVVNVTVGSSATVGAATLRVINGDQVFGASTGAVTVSADGTAPVVSSVQAGAVGATTAMISWTTNEPSNSQVFFLSGPDRLPNTAIDPQMTGEHAVTRPADAGEDLSNYVRSADARATPRIPRLCAASRRSLRAHYIVRGGDGADRAPVATTPRRRFRGGWSACRPGLPRLHQNPPAARASGSTCPTRATGTSGYGCTVLGSTDGCSRRWMALASATSSRATSAYGNGRQPMYTLDAGLHELRLAGHEAEARVDRILYRDPNFVPTEQPGDRRDSSGSRRDAQAVALETACAWADRSVARQRGDARIRYRTDGSSREPRDGCRWCRSRRAGEPGTSSTSLDGRTTYTYSISRSTLPATHRIARASRRPRGHTAGPRDTCSVPTSSESI